MAFDNTVTVVGNITRDPELRFTPSGAAVANFGLAWNRKGRDGEEVVSFFDVTAWNQLAENASESLSKGMRVVVYGRLDQRSWETQDGDRRSKVEIIADDIAPSLKWATAEINRNERRDGAPGGGGGYSGGGNGGGGNSGGGGGGGSRPASSDVPAYDPNEEPF
jgi:single-strand DNA-binding protein